MELMLPFLRDMPLSGIRADRALIFGRPSEDFLGNCLLFRTAERNSMNQADVQRLRSATFRVCYSYEMLDLENREFTEGGYQAICRDIRRAVEWGYTHIQLSNPYIIELVTNEFAGQIQVVISSLLDFDSGRARVFLDVLNDPTPVTHVVISQPRLTRDRFREMQEAFTGLHLVVEVDRWLSDVQIIHDRYYNVLYGYDSEYARLELRRLATLPAIRQALRPVRAFLFEVSGVLYKVGEINTNVPRVLANIEALQRRQYDLLRNVDLETW